MISFLKQYSSIPEQFIDDFYGIMGENNNPHDFVIDFDIVAKWFGRLKGNLKKTLMSNFDSDIDYIIIPITKNHDNYKGSTVEEKIMLTVLCFKELCMICRRSPNAEKVRLYYIALEGLMVKYHHYIEKSLREKIGLLEQNQKPKINVEIGIIYFFEALNVSKIDDEMMYKLGKTTDKNNRFNTYNSGNANDIEPLFILEVNDIDSVEGCIINLLKKYQYRKHKEIYKIDKEALKEAFMMCDELVKGFVRYERKHGKEKLKKSAKKLQGGGFLLMKITKMSS
uniref:Bacteriophage T5 Orf172 DNA-binding domain-containing protein n=1 Tax=viral metagenome TaxID=1070528 RepID=A0A6C0C847_9ZZZZ